MQKTLVAAPFKPTSPLTGGEQALLRAENLLIEGNYPNVYMRAYRGSLDMNEQGPTQAITGTIEFDPSTRVITGTGTTFLDELHLGQMIQADNGEVIVVGQLLTQLTFTADRTPLTTASGQGATRLPVIFPLNINRGTLLRGNAVQFDKGTIIAVGDGELRVNGLALSGDSLTASRTAQVAVYDSATMTYRVEALGFDEIPIVANTDVSVVSSGGVKNMSPGYYSFKVSYYSDVTNGFGNPTDTLLSSGTAGYQISAANSTFEIDFTGDVANRPDKATGYIIWGSAFSGSSDISAVNAIQGGWFEAKRVAFTDLIAETVAFEYTDSELAVLVSFDNDTPPDAEFIGTIDNYPFVVSTDGQGVDSPGRETSTSPGPFVAPAKPENLDAYPAGYKVPTTHGETILGVVSAAGRFFVMTPNTLQAVTPTGLPAAPFTCRPFWKRGFVNPYNLIFINDTLYGYSGQKLFRSTGTGDQSEESYTFASDVEAQLAESSGGYVFIAHDPKNELICVFLSAIRQNASGYWETDVYPYSLTKSIWQPKVVLTSTDRDMVVSGAATVNNELYFLAGGRDCDEDAVAFNNAAGITDPVEREAICQLVTALKEFEIWDKMLALYPFVGGTSDTMKYNLKDPRDADAAYRITWAGSITFDDNGVTGDGATGYGNTHLNPLSTLTNGNTHLSLYSRTQADLPGQLPIGLTVGGATNYRFGMYIRYGDFWASEQYREGTSGGPHTLGTTDLDGRGFYSASRIANDDFKIYKNGAVAATSTDIQLTAMEFGEIFILAMSTDGTASNFSSRNFAFASIGLGLTETDEANFYTAVQAFNSALDREVA